MMRLLPLAIALVLTAPAFAAPQSSSPEDPRHAAAREFYKTGALLFERGRFIDAAQEFEHAYAEQPLPALLYNIASAYDKGGARMEAAQAYRRYAAATSNESDSAAARARADVLEREQQESGGAKASTPAPPAAPPTSVAQSSALPASAPRKPGAYYSTEISVGADVGFIYTTGLYDVSIAVAPGVDLPKWSFHMNIGGDIGSAGFGLLTGEVRFAPDFMGVWGRVRFGGGPDWGALFIHRITTIHTMWDSYLGGHLKLSVDLLQRNRRALYLALVTTVDTLLVSPSEGKGNDDSSSGYYSAGLLLGTRF